MQNTNLKKLAIAFAVILCLTSSILIVYAINHSVNVAFKLRSTGALITFYNPITYSKAEISDTSLNLTNFQFSGTGSGQQLKSLWGIETNKNTLIQVLNDYTMQFYVSGSGTATVTLFGFTEPSSITGGTFTYSGGVITVTAQSPKTVYLRWDPLSENYFKLILFVFGFALMLISIGIIFLTRPDMEKTALLVMTAIIGFGIWWGVGL